MSQALDFGMKLLFRLRWAVMSQEQRYALLLARTRRQPSTPREVGRSPGTIGLCNLRLASGGGLDREGQKAW
jgi:hypothetical protein